MKSPGISIVISTYGRTGYLQNLISSVRSSTPQDAYEFVVVSSDPPESEKIKWLQRQKDIDLILADVRKEWQLRKRSAYYYINLGIKSSKKEWAFVVSDDMYFDKDWYKEFANLASDPKNYNVGAIIVSTHLGKVKYGRRIYKIGKTRKKGGEWRDLYLADLSIISRETFDKIGLFDERIDWYGGGADISLAIQFLTEKDIIASEKIKVDHAIAKENRSSTIGNEFTGFNYIIRKWNKWCKENNCQYIWDPGVKPYTIPNRIENYLRNRVRILRHYIRYAVKKGSGFFSSLPKK